MALSSLFRWGSFQVRPPRSRDPLGVRLRLRPAHWTWVAPLALLACGIRSAPLPEEEGRTFSASTAPALATPPIELLRASCSTVAFEQPERVEGIVAVAKMAGPKTVVIRYRYVLEGQPWSEWAEVPAVYAAPLDESRERWSFSLPPIPPSYRGTSVDFSLKVTAQGKTYEDDRRGHYYHVGNGYLSNEHLSAVPGPSTDVLLSQATFLRGRLHAGIVVRDKPGARVWLRYSKDHGQTFERVEARWAYGFGQGQSMYFAYAEVDSAHRIQLSVALEAEGKTFVDDNFGQTYDVSPWLGVAH